MIRPIPDERYYLLLVRALSSPFVCGVHTRRPARFIRNAYFYAFRIRSAISRVNWFCEPYNSETSTARVAIVTTNPADQSGWGDSLTADDLIDAAQLSQLFDRIQRIAAISKLYRTISRYYLLLLSIYRHLIHRSSHD